jgi:hypothetical protein
MDIISHGLYGGVTFGRRSRISYWKAFFFGVLPDLSSFGLFMVLTILGISSGPDMQFGPPNPHEIPSYVYTLYNVSHSFLTAFLVFGIVWFVYKKPMFELLAWPLHILVDIPTHSSEFFPTPFLWPLSDFTVNGISWGQPVIFIPNVVLLIGLYVWFFYKKYHKTI